MSYYESPEMLDQYLLFHYGSRDQTIPYSFGPNNAYGFPFKIVQEFLDRTKLKSDTRALDLGCAVGRSSFELARFCDEVIGIDSSNSFIQAAKRISEEKFLEIKLPEEGLSFKRTLVKCPENIQCERIVFAVGDAQNLSRELGSFDVVLLSNLIDRLPDPKSCLKNLATFVKPGGQLIIASPYTWLEEFTEKSNWLAGNEAQESTTHSLDMMKSLLDVNFRLNKVGDLPFLIREHARRYQWSVAQVSSWIKV